VGFSKARKMDNNVKDKLGREKGARMVGYCYILEVRE
jgi:hypothetical protein